METKRTMESLDYLFLVWMSKYFPVSLEVGIVAVNLIPVLHNHKAK